MKKLLEEKSIPKPVFILLLILFALIFLMVGGIIILKTGIYSSAVSGHSMEKTLSAGTKLLTINKSFKKIKRGDIVCIRVYADGKKISLVKRIIAMPGEIIDIQGKKVYVNGDLLKEPYAYYSGESKDNLVITLKKNEYFFMGDNRINSEDSRYIGPAPEDSITDVVLLYRK